MGSHLSSKINQTSEFTSKQWGIVFLLLAGCVLSAFMLYNTEPVQYKNLSSSTQLDSLITLTFNEMNVPSDNVRMHTVEIDSLFYRNVYSATVPQNFSKTTFHYTLHNHLWPYRAQTVAKVQFPDRSMNIHLLVNDKVRRTVFLQTSRTDDNILRTP